MQLKPMRPPGRSDRKALRYMHEVRRLRAEGHTLDSIRQALLDVGVSVSLSAIRRELAHPPSKWEQQRAQDAALALEAFQPSRAAAETRPWPQQLGAGSGHPGGPAGGESGLANIQVVGDRRNFDLLCRVLATLRRLRGALPIP
jgi:hypothetical protein